MLCPKGRVGSSPTAGTKQPSTRMGIVTEEQAEQSTASAPRRVVVAEDESLIRLDIVEILRDNGFDVVGEAGDGETAVALATELRPDLVIMDVNQGTDGMDTGRRHRDRASLPQNRSMGQCLATDANTAVGQSDRQDPCEESGHRSVVSVCSGIAIRQPG